MSRVPKVGDRVMIECDQDLFGGVPGTVIDVSPKDNAFSVQRDDDRSGSGALYKSPKTGRMQPSWLCYTRDLEDGFVRFLDEAEPAEPASTPHIMGLSSEEIDWSAHKAFTRDM